MIKNLQFVLFITGIMLVLSACRDKPGPLFTRLPAAETGIDFRNDPATGDSLNFLDYLYYYNGGGVAAGDINNDGLADLFFTANRKGGNRLYLNRGGFRFEDITVKAGVAGKADWSTGVTMADINGDGWLDIYVCAVSGKLGLTGKNELFINDGNGGFREAAAEFGLDVEGFCTQAAFFDYDHDGDLDCYLLSQSSHSVDMYRDTSLRRTPGGMAGDKFFRNEGLVFKDVSRESGIYASVLGYGLGLAVADLNNDGWEDIYVGNDFHENDYYYVNNRDGTFSEQGARVFGHYSRFSMGNDIADYNNDGYPDIFTADMLPQEERFLKTYSGGDALDIYKFTIERNGFQHQYSRNALQQNLGDGQLFSETGLLAAVAATDWSWSPLFADFDNDGYKDLFVSNGIVRRPVDLDYVKYISNSMVQKEMSGSSRLDQQALENMPDGKTHDYIFQGTSSGVFTDRSASWGFTEENYSNGASYADLDNDGWLDLIINRIGEPAGIYRNEGSGGQHWLQVKLEGNSGNTLGIGAKVWIWAGGNLLYQQLMTTRGFQSASTPVLHFGLGNTAKADSLRIVWPDGRTTLLKDLSVDTLLTIRYQPGLPSFTYPAPFPALFEDLSESLQLKWSHRENDFNDFNRHRLQPHLLSAMGPKMTVADINGDQLDDVYVCGARGQQGVLLIQQQDGSLLETFPFQKENEREETDALFFDADGDGDQDLYITSGGNEFGGEHAMLADRLYLNNGRGGFANQPQLIPVYANKTAVTAADIDRDGDIDVFLAVMAEPGTVGLAPKNYLLLNDGQGNFTTANHLLDNERPGMVTGAVFSDLDQDGWPDLVLAGEWMEILILQNNHGKFETKAVKGSAGLWQTISITDINGDGKPDILAGNYGLNSKLHASESDPLRMYTKDFDGNGQIEQLLSYSVDRLEYSFLGKDELEVQLPYLKKSFLRYRDFAGKTVTEFMGPNLGEAAIMQATTLRSGIFFNRGRATFEFQPLPLQAQYAPLFVMLAEDVNADGLTDIVTAGNFYGVSPYEGRYDGNPGFVFLQNKATGFEMLPLLSTGLQLRGQVKSIKRISLAGKPAWLVGTNNQALRLYRKRPD